ncbi:apoptosis regulator BAX-like [Danio aesculapii]|uniref:apoptosis regulator BAX-like n=1 Tax=Danio aesculapii TaxID=1142201 RepID=UPI0024BF83D7|nr:apoptosis regulator BAX-like [Danio aesculapii]
MSDPSHKELSECMVKIAFQLDENEKLERWIKNDLSFKPTKDVYVDVTSGIFSDGIFNWGRVVALFYIAYQFVIKAAEIRCVDSVRSIINWTMSSIRKYSLKWIREQGGWDGIRSYFRTPTWQTIGDFLAGVLTAGLVVYKNANP